MKPTFFSPFEDFSNNLSPSCWKREALGVFDVERNLLVVPLEATPGRNRSHPSRRSRFHRDIIDANRNRPPSDGCFVRRKRASVHRGVLPVSLARGNTPPLAFLTARSHYLTTTESTNTVSRVFLTQLRCLTCKNRPVFVKNRLALPLLPLRFMIHFATIDLWADARTGRECRLLVSNEGCEVEILAKGAPILTAWYQSLSEAIESARERRPVSAVGGPQLAA
jgi:hypothetical protein